MPADRTVVTELATALGTLPYHGLTAALSSRPAEMRLSSATWDRLDALYESRGFADDFAVAYANGQSFAASEDALAGRPPRVIEWTGGRRPAGDEVAPIDLRIDHVYMLSCKYLSANIWNASPARLFDGLLATSGSWDSADWYHEVAPAEYQSLYEATVRAAQLRDVPDTADQLSTRDRARLRAASADAGGDEAVEHAYSRMAEAVAAASAARWRNRLAEFKAVLMLCRLLRIGNAPYFLVGAHGSHSVRLRVATVWDWRDHFELRDLSIEGIPAGQPKVEWIARYRTKDAHRETRSLRGHVEIRWSHGRFAQPPEAKVYLDTPVDQVPGYFTLDGGPSRLFYP